MEQIRKILKDLEQKQNIKVLHACETGSRGWGFPSPDSDFDVRFIYVHPKDWYLSLRNRKDSVELMENDLDITGWDLRKSLLLLRKSNVPMIERFRSPIMYLTHPEFVKRMNELITHYYSPISVFYHHHSLASKFWQELKDEEKMKLKSCFYLFRSLLSCMWTIREKSVLPMNIFELMKLLPDFQQQQLMELIHLKASVGEKYLHSDTEWIKLWVDDSFEFVNTSKDNLAVNNSDMEMLDAYFLTMLNEYDDN